MNPQIRKSPITWDLALFFALYVILPSYFAVEFSARLPLLTASRFLLVLVGIMLVIRRRKDLFDLRHLSLQNLRFGLTGDSFLRWGILIYFALLFITDLALIPADAGEALKASFVLLVEGYALVWILTHIIDTREKLVAALGVLVLASGVTAVISIVGIVLDVNFFHYLKTVTRDMLMTTYYRSGVLRAEAGFGHPVFYGAFCSIILPINMYFVEHAKSRNSRILFAASMVLTLTALVLSNSRGSLTAVLIVAALIFCLRLLRKTMKQFLVTFVPICAAAMVLLLLVSSAAPNGVSFLSSISQSLAKIAPSIFHTEMLDSPDSTDDDLLDGVEFGENEGGMRSRLRQMTAITWTLRRQPIFGFGSNAHVRGLLKSQYVDNQWWTIGSLDMGITAIICQFGIVGLLGYCALYGSISKTLLSKKYRGDTLLEHLGLAFITYLLCLITIASLDKVDWILFSAIVCAVNTYHTPALAD